MKEYFLPLPKCIRLGITHFIFLDLEIRNMLCLWFCKLFPDTWALKMSSCKRRTWSMILPSWELEVSFRKVLLMLVMWWEGIPCVDWKYQSVSLLIIGSGYNWMREDISGITFWERFKWQYFWKFILWC